jgi:hypothetical protein
MLSAARNPQEPQDDRALQSVRIAVCDYRPDLHQSVPEAQVMTAKVIQLRDFKRREENDADLVRLAKEVMGLIDTAPSEMPPVQPSYTADESDPA